MKGYNSWGESTREFEFDQKRRLFHLFEADFTAPRPSKGREIKLISVDAKTGIASTKVVAGATDFPSSFAYDSKTDKLLMATTIAADDSKSTAASFKFFVVDPDTAEASLVGTTTPSSTESEPAHYAGFFSSYEERSEEAHVVYRLGYKSVATQTSPGKVTCSCTTL